MSQLVESIRIYNGKVYNIQRHNARCNKSRLELFGVHTPLDLRAAINIPDKYKIGLVKCRVTYDQAIKAIDFEHYKVRGISKIAIVENPNINYNYKMVNRPALDKIRHKANGFDEVIITKEGVITDAYYYNIVLKTDGQYLTPKACLLPGVMRQKLIEQGRITTHPLSVTDLKKAKYIYLINALTPLGVIRLNPEQITQLKK